MPWLPNVITGSTLRGCMLLLGILLHAATFHLLEIGAPDVKPSVLILTILGIIHQCRMPLFFMLAGFFAAMLVQSYDIRGALENRSKRILLSFLPRRSALAPPLSRSRCWRKFSPRCRPGVSFSC